MNKSYTRGRTGESRQANTCKVAQRQLLRPSTWFYKHVWVTGGHSAALGFYKKCKCGYIKWSV